MSIYIMKYYLKIKYIIKMNKAIIEKYNVIMISAQKMLHKCTTNFFYVQFYPNLSFYQKEALKHILNNLLRKLDYKILL